MRKNLTIYLDDQYILGYLKTGGDIKNIQIKYNDFFQRFEVDRSSFVKIMETRK